MEIVAARTFNLLYVYLDILWLLFFCALLWRMGKTDSPVGWVGSGGDIFSGRLWPVLPGFGHPLGDRSGAIPPAALDEF